MVVNYNGDRVYDGENYTLFVGISQPDSASVKLMNKAPFSKMIKLV